MEDKEKLLQLLCDGIIDNKSRIREIEALVKKDVIVDSKVIQQWAECDQTAEVLKILEPKLDQENVNYINNQFGGGALHTIIECQENWDNWQDILECERILLEHGYDITIKNKKDQNVVDLANEMIEHLPASTDKNNGKKFVELTKKNLDKFENIDIDIHNKKEYIRNNNDDKIPDEWKDEPTHVKIQFLQESILYCRPNCMKHFLDQDMDQSTFDSLFHWTLMNHTKNEECAEAKLKIFNNFIDWYKEIPYDILFTLCRYIDFNNNSLYVQYFENILKKIECLPQKDMYFGFNKRFNCTPLHSIAIYVNEIVLNYFVENNFDFFETDGYGQRPIDAVTPEILKKLFDMLITLITLQKQHPWQKTEITFEYKEFVTIQLLQFLSNNENYKELMTHPLIKSFLEKVWYGVQLFFAIVLIINGISWIIILFIACFIPNAIYWILSLNILIFIIKEVIKRIEIKNRGNCLSNKKCLIFNICLSRSSIFTLMLKTCLNLSSIFFAYMFDNTIGLSYILLLSACNFILDLSIVSVNINMYMIILIRICKFLLFNVVLIVTFISIFYILAKEEHYFTVFINVIKGIGGDPGLIDTKGFSYFQNITGFLFILFIILTLQNVTVGIATDEISQIRNEANLITLVAKTKYIATNTIENYDEKHLTIKPFKEIFNSSTTISISNVKYWFSFYLGRDEYEISKRFIKELREYTMSQIICKEN